MHTELSKAMDTLLERRGDLGLRNKVESVLGQIPEPLSNCKPKVVLARVIATPNRESERFAETAEALGLDPVWFEYLGDRFTTINPDKVKLAKPTFDCGVGRNGGAKLTTHKLVDLRRWEGAPFKSVMTTWGEPLTEVHHRLFQAANIGAAKSDMSEWLQNHGGSADRYYTSYLALFVYHGILCENFTEMGKEAEFTRRIVKPAIRRVEEMFGVPPIIVSHLPMEKVYDPTWGQYRGELMSALRDN